MKVRSNTMLATATVASMVLMGSLGSTNPAQAATLYWDGDGAAGDNPAAPNGGTWNPSASTIQNWNTASDFTGTYGNWDQVGGQDTASFSSTGFALITVAGGGVDVNHIITESGSSTVRFTGDAINFTGVAEITPGGGQTSFYNNITGTNGLTINGSGPITFESTQKTFTGDLTFNGGGFAPLAGPDNVLPTTARVIFAAGNKQIFLNVNQQLAGLSSTGSGTGYIRKTTTNASIPSTTLTLNDTTGTLDFAGVLIESTGTFNLVKQGNYTQIMSGISTSTSEGSTTVEGGVLALNKTANLDALGVGSIAITGGTLRLDNNNQINDASAMSLGGGTFDLNDNDETLGALTLDASSTLAFGGSDSIVTFDSFTVNAGILTITGWDGDEAGGGSDQLRFVSDPTALLAAFDFGVGFDAAVIDFSGSGYYEVVAVAAVPEPASLALLGLGGMMILGRRKCIA